MSLMNCVTEIATLFMDTFYTWQVPHFLLSNPGEPPPPPFHQEEIEAHS